MLAVLDAYQDGDSLAWSCFIRKLDSDAEEELELEFENRGRIVLRLFGQSQFTDDYEIFIRCQRQFCGEIIQMDRRFLPSERLITFKGLPPGEYKITAQVPRLGREEFELKVTIPTNAPFRATEILQLPSFRFGSLKAGFLLPDGKSPAANLRLWIEAQAGEASGFGLAPIPRAHSRFMIFRLARPR